METAAAEVIAGLKYKTLPRDQVMREMPPIQIILVSSGGSSSKSLRELSADSVSSLVRLRGIVVSASKVRSKALVLVGKCRCGHTVHIPVGPGFTGAAMPNKCQRAEGSVAQPCPYNPYVVVPDESTFSDQQTLKIQENPEELPSGELPRTILATASRYLCNIVQPGTRISVLGIYSIFQAGGKRQGLKGREEKTGVKRAYLRLVGIESLTETDSSSSALTTTFTRDVLCRTFKISAIDDGQINRIFKHIASKPNLIDIIKRSVAPALFGHDTVKLGLACQLFGGSRKSFPDGTKCRGDINILLMGDPGVGKSQFLKWMHKTAPVAVYTSGKGSSAAGLTAAVTKDLGSGEFYLEGGAMVLSDGGVCCIDEFDKMSDTDRVAIHEAMEQQTVSVAKAGITTILNARSSVLAAANPVSGRYDDLRSAAEQIEFQSTILSRFDLIYIMKDRPSVEADQKVAEHVISLHERATVLNDHLGSSIDVITSNLSLIEAAQMVIGASLDSKTTEKDETSSKDEEDEEDGEETKESKALKKAASARRDQSYLSSLDIQLAAPNSTIDGSLLSAYASYTRQYIHPRLGESAVDRLKDAYIRMRKEADGDEGKSAPGSVFRSKRKSGSTVPITVRQLEAMVRIAEAFARIEMKELVTEEHVERAIELFSESTMAAVRTGAVVVEGMMGTAAQKDVEEVKELVRNRLPYGASIGVKHIRADLMSRGKSMGLVDKALYSLIRERNFELIKQGNILRRIR
ncbi:DNA replication licensing factor MCM5 [Aduncisulcus paluster]|uniref:DNA helicase n=1 Tax=Aduncisulcus paluster TaxID=2918883 RepID=A0ABQ5KYW4_9EUKA|nr:DNA replication licensing factor MCM5 [Aduncisulcus paluster]